MSPDTPSASFSTSSAAASPLSAFNCSEFSLDVFLEVATELSFSNSAPGTSFVIAVTFSTNEFFVFVISVACSVAKLDRGICLLNDVFASVASRFRTSPR